MRIRSVNENGVRLYYRYATAGGTCPPCVLRVSPVCAGRDTTLGVNIGNSLSECRHCAESTKMSRISGERFGCGMAAPSTAALRSFDPFDLTYGIAIYGSRFYFASNAIIDRALPRAKSHGSRDFLDFRVNLIWFY